MTHYACPLAVLLLLGLAACDRPTGTTPNDAAPGALPEPSVLADSIVAVDSTLRFEAHLQYPQLRDAGPYTDAINAALADSARAYVEAFRPSEVPPSDCMSCAAEVEGGFEVARLDDRVFSGLLSTYWYTGGAHGNTDFLPLNYDLTTGQRITLADLFMPGSAYLDTLSVRTRADLARQAEAGGMTSADFWEEGSAPEAVNFQRFTLGPDSLTIHFPPYQVGPYAAGSFATALAYADLQSVLVPDGRLRP